MSGRYSNQHRLKAQLLCTCFILVFIVLVMVINHQSNPFHSDRGDLEANLLTASKNIDIVLPIYRNNKDTSGKSKRPDVLTRQRQTNKYNLMEEVEFEKFKQFLGGNKCNLEYINKNKLPQDHPCVIETIRRHYLKAPSPPDVPLNLVSDGDDDRSPGQTGVILRLLKNQTNGFFVECGALDGEFMSNTIDLERKFNWGGILIEANPITFQKLISRNRKAYTVPICLSLEPFPTKVTFQPKSGDPGHSHIEGEAKTLQKPGIPGVDPGLVTIQCFPFYSVLLAVGQTQIDFFSLDVEGHELKILKTIPWYKVDIKSLTVEWDNMPEGKEALIRFMEDSGFITIGAFDFQWSRDVIFIKDLINTHQ